MGRRLLRNVSTQDVFFCCFFSPFQTCSLQAHDSDDITWGNLSDLTQLPVEPQKGLTQLFKYIRYNWSDWRCTFWSKLAQYWAFENLYYDFWPACSHPRSSGWCLIVISFLVFEVDWRSVRNTSSSVRPLSPPISFRSAHSPQSGTLFIKPAGQERERNTQASFCKRFN